MPTRRGFTGQRADAASGLDYQGARYYDPAADQFASADTAGSGLNRFAYVGDNPISRIDPTGHDWFDTAMDWGGNALSWLGNAVGVSDIQRDQRIVHDPHASWQDMAGATANGVGVAVNDWLLLTGVGDVFDAASVGVRALFDEGGALLGDAGTQGGKTLASDATTRAAGDLPGDEGSQVAGDMGDTGGGVAGAGDAGGDTTLYRGKQIGQTPGPPSSGDLGIPGRPNVNGAIDIKPKGGMVGPSYTGKQGLSTFDGMNPAVRNVQGWWQTSEGSLPQGLRAIPGAPKPFTHYSIAPASDMTIDAYMALFDSIPWLSVP